MSKFKKKFSELSSYKINNYTHKYIEIYCCDQMGPELKLGCYLQSLKSEVQGIESNKACSGLHAKSTNPSERNHVRQTDKNCLFGEI